MKKIIITITATFLFFSCGIFKTVDLEKLTVGMSKEEVVTQIGPPLRVLSVNQTDNGYQEILEYKTYRREVYALEFWNDYLTGFEFLYEDVVYTPAPAPPAVLPAYGKPLYKPSKPIKPSPPNKPNKPNPPSKPSKPNPPSKPSTPTRSQQDNRSEKSGTNNQPERRSGSTQSGTSDRQSSTRSAETTPQRSTESEGRSRENTDTNTTRDQRPDSERRTNTSR